MSEYPKNYLGQQLDAFTEVRDRQLEITFQRERIKLDDPIEVTFIESLDRLIQRKVEWSDVELKIRYQFDEPLQFSYEVFKENELSRLYFSQNLVKKLKFNNLSRLQIVISPENVIYDDAMQVYFLHFGVENSVPPYISEDKRLLQEVRALCCAAIEPKYDFFHYLSYSTTSAIPTRAKKIMACESLSALQETISEMIQNYRKYEKSITSIPIKKWKTTKYSFIGVSVLLIPLVIYVVYSLTFSMPKYNAYIASQEQFLNSEYSNVVDQLEPYDAKKMPYVTKYMLSLSYVTNEQLDETQRDNVLKTITLQTDERYFLFWIYIGRGESEEALKIARELEDIDLTIFALLNQEENVKNDSSLDSEKKKQKLDSIKQEIEDYKRQLDEAKKEDQAETTGSELDSTLQTKDTVEGTDKKTNDSGKKASLNENKSEKKTEK
ncbi:type VII secretion protein EssB [Rummeliibacillus pycnus]|uniref:type VII secretion protein EssB n=1 Tax=Rummeliibacillus pycnus TaxID=101070 RepID=UPI0037C6CFA2